jgi:NodT family efflux transporter outer membrane factor (OMF) lipoprotein
MQTCKWLVGAVACFCLGGCAVGPNYHPPETKMPDNFIASSSQTQKSAENKDNQPVIDAAKWWQALDDQELNSLIERAIQANLDIQIALTRLQEARTAVSVVIGTALPSAGFSAGGADGTGNDLTRGGRVAGPLAAAETTTNKGNLKQVEYIVGFAGAWEIDFAGKYRRAIEAAKYDTQAAIAIRNFVLISVIADVVRAYIDMRAFQMELDVLQKNIAVAQDYVNLTQERFDRGITNELDLALAQRTFGTLQAQEKPLVDQVAAAQYVIAVLVGQFPEDLAPELQKPGVVPQLPEKIEPGLPLDLLRRRPDILEAERELAGATARIGVATADLFPRVVLTGGFGWEGGEVGPTVTSVTTVTVNKITKKKTTTTTALPTGAGGGVLPNIISPIWSLGPSIAWPLLDFGTLDSLVDIADLRTCEALLRYKKTVLNAISEVDTSVGAYAAQQERLRSLGDALTASQRVMSLAMQRYERGLTDFLNVIDAERQEYDLEEQYVASLREAGDQFIALYKALGAGWEQYQSFPPIRRPLPAVFASFERLLHPAETKKCDW